MTDYQPVPQPQNRPNRRPLFIALGFLAAVAVAAVVVLLVFGPKAADKMDSGVQACKYISEGRGPNGEPTDAPDAEPSIGPDGRELEPSEEVFTPEEYKDLREVFTDSRHDDIATAGARFVDDAYNMNLFGVMSSYGALNGACTSHGYPLPALTSK